MFEIAAGTKNALSQIIIPFRKKCVEGSGSEWNKQFRHCRVFLPLPAETVGTFYAV